MYVVTVIRCYSLPMHLTFKNSFFPPEYQILITNILSAYLTCFLGLHFETQILIFSLIDLWPVPDDTVFEPQIEGKSCGSYLASEISNLVHEKIVLKS